MGEGMKKLEEHKISTWRSVFEADGHLKPFVAIDPSERSVARCLFHSEYRNINYLLNELFYLLNNRIRVQPR